MRKLADLLKETKAGETDKFEEAMLYIEARILLIRYLVSEGCTEQRFSIENELLALDLEAIRVYAEGATSEQMERLQKISMEYVNDMIGG